MEAVIDALKNGDLEQVKAAWASVEGFSADTIIEPATPHGPPIMPLSLAAVNTRAALEIVTWLVESQNANPFALTTWSWGTEITFHQFVLHFWIDSSRIDDFSQASVHYDFAGCELEDSVTDYLEAYVKNAVATFMEAARQGDTETIDHWLKQGLCVNVTDERGYSALHYAALSGNVDTVAFLFDYDYDKLPVKAHYIHIGPEPGHWDPGAQAIHRLSENILEESIPYDSPLTAAIRQGHLPIVDFILKRARTDDLINLGIPTGLNLSYHPLSVALEGKPNKEIVKRLLKERFHPKDVLLILVAQGQTQLLKHYASPEKLKHNPEFKNLLLHNAVRLGHFDLVLALLDTYKADPNMVLEEASDIHTQNPRPLHQCVVPSRDSKTHKTKEKIARLLIQHGADVDLLDGMDRTALQLAYLENDLAFCQLLAPLEAEKHGKRARNLFLLLAILALPVTLLILLIAGIIAISQGVPSGKRFLNKFIWFFVPQDGFVVADVEDHIYDAVKSQSEGGELTTKVYLYGDFHPTHLPIAIAMKDNRVVGPKAAVMEVLDQI